MELSLNIDGIEMYDNVARVDIQITNVAKTAFNKRLKLVTNLVDRRVSEAATETGPLLNEIDAVSGPAAVQQVNGKQGPTEAGADDSDAERVVVHHQCTAQNDSGLPTMASITQKNKGERAHKPSARVVERVIIENSRSSARFLPTRKKSGANESQPRSIALLWALPSSQNCEQQRKGRRGRSQHTGQPTGPGIKRQARSRGRSPATTGVWHNIAAATTNGRRPFIWPRRNWQRQAKQLGPSRYR